LNDISTILVVDDDSDSLRLLTEILSSEGYSVRPADSGELALASVRANAPQLIVLDIRMPGIDGFEVCRRLHSEERSRHIPVILLSSAGQVEDRVKGLSLGAADFISKPYDRSELVARVRTQLELYRLRAGLEKEVVERTAELRFANHQLAIELEERRRTEHELRESEARFRHLADGAPVGIWITASNGAVIFYNRRALAFLGRKFADLATPPWTQFVHPDDLETAEARYTDAVLARRNFRIECRIRRPNRKYRCILHTGVPRFVGGVFYGYIGTSTDITDLKRNHEELLVHQKLESLGVLAAGVAHDFNNLMGSILAEADIALTDIPAQTPGRDSVERISGIAERASDIVNLLMTYAGERDLAFEPVDLSRITSEVLFLMKSTLNHSTEVDVRLDNKLPAVQANKAQIRQVVLNLFANASEALKGRAGKITVTTGLLRLGKASAAKRNLDLPCGEYCYLSVSDTGCGMSQQAQAKAFDPFYTTKFVGRGLGLAAVQGILRSHGGAITVVSAPERGSTFEVFLPRAARRPRQRPAKREALERSTAAAS
jgi:PAS domain S-box-containing protein